MVNAITNKIHHQFFKSKSTQISESEAKMVAKQLLTEQLVRDLMINLHSSNVHYVTRETPFSLYVTVRKRLREISPTGVPEPKSLKDPTHYDVKDLEDVKKNLENELNEKILECSELSVSKGLLQVRLEKADAELLDKTLEIDEFKDRNIFLQKRLAKAEADLLDKTFDCNEVRDNNFFLQERFDKTETELLNTCKSANDEKDKIVEKNKFLITSVKRSTEETLAMERKFDVAKKATKKKEAEIISLKLKLEALMQTNKKLEDDKNTLLTKVPHAFQSNENNQTERSDPSSLATLNHMKNSTTLDPTSSMEYTTCDSTSNMDTPSLEPNNNMDYTTLDPTCSMDNNTLDLTSQSSNRKIKTRQNHSLKLEDNVPKTDNGDQEETCANSGEQLETESKDADEDFSHLNPDEQAVLSQISKIIRGTFS